MEAIDTRPMDGDGDNDVVNDVSMSGSSQHVDVNIGLTKPTSNGGTTGETTNGTTNGEDADDDNPQCGWFGLRPRCIQVQQIANNQRIQNNLPNSF